MNISDIKELSKQYEIELKEAEKAEKTIRSYLSDINKFVLFCEASGADEISKETIITYKDSMKQEKKTSSINRAIISLNKFFKFANADDLTGVKALKQQQKASIDNIVSENDYERLLRAALNPSAQAQKAGLKPDPQLWALMQTLANTGIRFGELKYFTVESLSDAVKNGDCITVNNKGKERAIPVSKELQKLLKQYCKEMNIQSGYIFGTRNSTPLSNEQISRRMKKLAGYARVNKSKVHPHSFRHLFGKTYMQEIGRLDELADILGHSDISTTRIYSRTSNKEKASNIGKLNLIKGKQKTK